MSENTAGASFPHYLCDTIVIRIGTIVLSIGYWTAELAHRGLQRFAPGRGSNLKTPILFGFLKKNGRVVLRPPQRFALGEGETSLSRQPHPHLVWGVRRGV